MLHRFDLPLNRRNLLLGGASLAAASALPIIGRSQEVIDYDWSDPNDNLEAYVKLVSARKPLFLAIGL